MFNVKVIGADATKNSLAVAADLVVATGPSRLYSVTLYNSSAGTVYLQVHDAAAAPADGAVPKLVVAVPAGQTGAFDWQDGKICGTGIYLCASTTDTTKTLAGAVGIFDCTYRRTS